MGEVHPELSEWNIWIGLFDLSITYPARDGLLFFVFLI